MRGCPVLLALCCATSHALSAKPPPSFGPPKVNEAAASAAHEALKAAHECLSAGDGDGAVRVLAVNAGDLLASGDGATLDALCSSAAGGGAGELRELVGDVLEAVAEEADAMDFARKDLLQRCVAASKSSPEALDRLVVEEADELVTLAFPEYLDAEIARLEASETPEPALVTFMQALRDRAAQALEAAIFGAGAEALRRVLEIDDPKDRRAAFVFAMEGEYRAGLLEALEQTRAELRARDDAPSDVLRALDELWDAVG